MRALLYIRALSIRTLYIKNFIGYMIKKAAIMGWYLVGRYA